MAIRQDEIYLNLPDDELEAYVSDADARIEAANHEYETSVLPPMRMAMEQARIDEKDSERRILDARVKATNIPPTEAEERGTPQAPYSLATTGA
jgi:hypothetical protein